MREFLIDGEIRSKCVLLEITDLMFYFRFIRTLLQSKLYVIRYIDVKSWLKCNIGIFVLVCISWNWDWAFLLVGFVWRDFKSIGEYEFEVTFDLFWMKHYNFSSNLIQVGEIQAIRAKSVRIPGFSYDIQKSGVQYLIIRYTISEHPVHNIRASGTDDSIVGAENSDKSRLTRATIWKSRQTRALFEP